MKLPSWITYSQKEKKYVIKESKMDFHNLIEKDDAFEYVLENYYDEVREAVFEQEAESRQE